MITKDKNFVERYFPDEYELVDDPYFGYEIHIGKRSIGWKPLFQDHNKAYKSVEEMKQFITNNYDLLKIYDEYGKFFTLKELQEELIDWGKNQVIRYMKYIPEGVPDKVFGGKTYLIESTADDYDITIPFDHIEYEKLNPYHEKYIDNGVSYCSKDKDGYDFTERSFS